MPPLLNARVVLFCLSVFFCSDDITWLRTQREVESEAKRRGMFHFHSTVQNMCAHPVQYEQHSVLDIIILRHHLFVFQHGGSKTSVQYI